MVENFPDAECYVSSNEAIRSWFQHVESLYVNGPPGQFIPTGFADLDALVFGWQRGALSVIAGRPGMGCCTLLYQTVVHTAVDENTPVAVVPLAKRLHGGIYQMVAVLSEIRPWNIRRGDLSEADWEQLIKTSKTLSEAPIHWLTTPRIFIGDLVEECARLANEEGVEALFIDCLQMLRARGEWQCFQEEVAEVTRGLKYIATELGLAVVASAQVNRNPESRVDHRPILSDIRSSAAIEYLADLVLLMYRDEVYHPDGEHSGIAEVTVAKSTNSTTGAVRLRYDQPWVRFINVH